MWLVAAAHIACRTSRAVLLREHLWRHPAAATVAHLTPLHILFDRAYPLSISFIPSIVSSLSFLPAA